MTRPTTILALLFSFFISSSLFAQQDTRNDDFLTQVQILIMDSYYDSHPEGEADNSGDFLTGMQLEKQGLHEEAVERFSETIKSDLFHVPAYIWRGISYCRLGKFEEASSDFSFALKQRDAYLNRFRFRGINYADRPSHTKPPVAELQLLEPAITDGKCSKLAKKLVKAYAEVSP